MPKKKFLFDRVTEWIEAGVEGAYFAKKGPWADLRKVLEHYDMTITKFPDALPNVFFEDREEEEEEEK